MYNNTYLATFLPPNNMAFVGGPTAILTASNVIVPNTNLMYSDDILDIPCSSSSLAPKLEATDSESGRSSASKEDKRMVPLCSICGSDSTGIHFGVDACAACSAFFRRTVVLNKNYSCHKNEQCNVTKGKTDSSKCRSCRFAKCLNQGMDRNFVQQRRDAIGKYSRVATDISEAQTSEFENSFSKEDLATPTPSPQCQQRLVDKGETLLLNEFIERHRVLNEKRRIFYAKESCINLFEDNDLSVRELHDYQECMYQLWHVEPRLAAEYISANRFLTQLKATEKVKLFRNFVVQRQAVEEPYMTWKYGGLDKNWWIMANKTYIDIDNAEKYFEHGMLAKMKLNYNDARSLFEGSFKNAMETIGEAMRAMDLTEREMIALCAIALLDPTVATLEKETRLVVWGMRERLVRDLFNHYQKEGGPGGEPELRLANLFMILAAVKVHAIRTSENMHLLNTFGLIAPDKMFEDICRGNVYDEYEMKDMNS